MANSANQVENCGQPLYQPEKVSYLRWSSISGGRRRFSNPELVAFSLDDA